MEWHQPWLLGLSQAELEDLHDDCRVSERANRTSGRFGLAQAWAGLAHEVTTRALELDARDRSETDRHAGQLALDVPRGPYPDR